MSAPLSPWYEDEGWRVVVADGQAPGADYVEWKMKTDDGGAVPVKTLCVHGSEVSCGTGKRGFSAGHKHVLKRSQCTLLALRRLGVGAQSQEVMVGSTLDALYGATSADSLRSSMPPSLVVATARRAVVDAGVPPRGASMVKVVERVRGCTSELSGEDACIASAASNMLCGDTGIVSHTDGEKKQERVHALVGRTCLSADEVMSVLSDSFLPCASADGTAPARWLVAPLLRSARILEHNASSIVVSAAELIAEAASGGIKVVASTLEDAMCKSTMDLPLQAGASLSTDAKGCSSPVALILKKPQILASPCYVRSVNTCTPTADAEWIEVLDSAVSILSPRMLLVGSLGKQASGMHLLVSPAQKDGSASRRPFPTLSLYTEETVGTRGTPPFVAQSTQTTSYASAAYAYLTSMDPASASQSAPKLVRCTTTVL